jgi:hypothetical protein
VTRRYAAETTVSADRSRAEIEATVSRYGGSGFGYAWEDANGSGRTAVVHFAMRGKYVRFVLRMPDPAERQFTHTAGRELERSEKAAREAWEQATRQHWRALALVVKAKLEAVVAGIATFEEEFLAYLVMPDGQTVGAHALPAVERAYLTGKVQRLLPAAVGVVPC